MAENQRKKERKERKNAKNKKRITILWIIIIVAAAVIIIISARGLRLLKIVLKDILLIRTTPKTAATVTAREIKVLHKNSAAIKRTVATIFILASIL